MAREVGVALAVEAKVGRVDVALEGGKEVS